MIPTSNIQAAGTLCRDCGLCCDGSLFSEVELADATESANLEAFGLSIEDEEEDEPAVLMQPCGALRGTRCSIYPHRPECCRTFECGLLKAVLKGTCSPRDASEKVKEIRAQIRTLQTMIRQVGKTSRQPLREQYQEAQEILTRRKMQPGALQSAELHAAMVAVEKATERDFLNA